MEYSEEQARTAEKSDITDTIGTSLFPDYGC